MLTAALLSAVAAVLVLVPPVSHRVARAGRYARSSAPTQVPSRHRWWASPPVAALVAAVAALQLVPAPVGILPAGGAALAAHQWVARAESAADRLRQERVSRDLPLAVDLLVACLAAGRPPGAALATVAAALRGPLAKDLRAVAAQLDLGADPLGVWQQLGRDPTLGALGRSLARASRSGSSVTTALSRCSDDLRRRRHSSAQAQARSVGVRAAGPLGLCFLPAFVIVGIVPTIVGLFGVVVR